jgi:RimJ/RimL family protein N-acetyltransferase
MYHPFIVGENIYLRGIEERDLADPYFQWFNDQESDAYTGHALWPNSKEKMLAFREKTVKSKQDMVLAIITKDEDLHIGNIGLHDIDWMHRHAKLAILIGEKAKRGRGYGSEAIMLVSKHAFERLNLHRIYVGIREDNQRAIDACRRVGFEEEGRAKQAFLSRGKYFDIICMSRISPHP